MDTRRGLACGHHHGEAPVTKCRMDGLWAVCWRLVYTNRSGVSRTLRDARRKPCTDERGV